MERLEEWRQLLVAGQYFKVVCGAGHEVEADVERLAYVYTLAGCNGFDVSAKPEVVQACGRGIEAAVEVAPAMGLTLGVRPFITVSVGMPGDHHVRKAVISSDCVACDLCIPACPTAAITADLVVVDPLCIGCGLCEAVCPPAAAAIRWRHDAKALRSILPACLQAGAESIELHAAVADGEATLAEWQVVNDCLPDGLVSLCLDRHFLSNHDLLERICRAHAFAGNRLMIQADGVPMGGAAGSGWRATLQAVAMADVIERELKARDPRFRHLPVVLSGGTNRGTGALAARCGVPFAGIAMGSQARGLVQQGLQEVQVGRVNTTLKALVAEANDLIETTLAREERTELR
jgi:ferredoxin